MPSCSKLNPATSPNHSASQELSPAIINSSRFSVRGSRCLGYLVSTFLVASAGAFGQESGDTSHQSLFGLNNVIDVHIHMELAEWQKMQPPEGTKMDFLSVMLVVFYPVTPTIYGFRIQRALGIRAASWVLFSVIALATWFVAAIIAFS